MSFEIRIGGKTFTDWASATYYRTIDSLCGTFTFNYAWTDFPISNRDIVQVYVSGQLQLTGYIDEKKGDGDASKTSFSITGRDLTQDIVDSSVPPDAKSLEGVLNLEQICEAVAFGLGMDIYATKNVAIRDFTEEELEAGASGENAFDFLQNLARKLQVYLITDPEGNIVIYRPGETRAQTPLIHRDNDPLNNIIRWSFSDSFKERYNQYVCRSQDNFAADEEADYEEGSDRNGVAYDKNIRSSRYLELTAEETMDETDCTNRAKEESNIRRARGQQYTAEVAGTTQSDGTVWQIGDIVKVVDDFANVNGFFIIRSVSMSISLSGEITKITIAPIDSYKAQDALDPTLARKSRFGY